MICRGFFFPSFQITQCLLSTSEKIAHKRVRIENVALLSARGNESTTQTSICTLGQGIRAAETPDAPHLDTQTQAIVQMGGRREQLRQQVATGRRALFKWLRAAPFAQSEAAWHKAGREGF